MATRNVALNELNFRGLSINPATGTNTINIVPSDSGVIFINKNDTANTNYVLPAVADGGGKMWWFLNAVTNAGFRVTAPTDTMVMNNSLIANYAEMAANKVGDAVMVIGDGSKYFLFEMSSNAFTKG